MAIFGPTFMLPLISTRNCILLLVDNGLLANENRSRREIDSRSQPSIPMGTAPPQERRSPTRPPEPRCPECGSADVRATLRTPYAVYFRVSRANISGRYRNPERHTESLFQSRTDSSVGVLGAC